MRNIEQCQKSSGAMTHTRADVVAAVRASFPAGDAARILSVLDLYGNFVGIDINNASRKVELDHLLVNKLPSDVTTVASQLRNAPDA